MTINNTDNINDTDNTNNQANKPATKPAIKQQDTAKKSANHKPNNQPSNQASSQKNNTAKDKKPAEPKVSNQAAQTSVAKEATPPPAMKMVDIVIAGVTYNIYCPVDEEAELHTAVAHINKFALNLKKDLPNLSQENLLLLCCLNLYEKSSHGKNNSNHDSKQNEALLKKIIHDAQAILE